MNQIEVCKKCNGVGSYAFDDQHIKPCELCCAHPDGWWKLEDHYGTDNGKYACKRGCGTIVDKPPQEKSTIGSTLKLQSEEDLMELTKEALTNVLGREPTRQEVLRAHAGFKRIAFHMCEHLRNEKEDEK